MEPRVVLVRRRTEYESLLQDHGTAQMAAFRLRQAGIELGDVAGRHHEVLRAAEQVLGDVPVTWRKTWVLREDLDRFLFGPDDIVVAVGLDGLVPNVAKYLSGQPVVGVLPFSGISQKMMAFEPSHLASLYRAGAPAVQRRAMVEVELDDGRRLTALNELFCGHGSHQSAKYDLQFSGRSEYQSSSGMIVATGTGATGWAQSIASSTGRDVGALPSPTERVAAFMVREAWASDFTGTSLVAGTLTRRRRLVVTSKMQEGGVIFGDGIESDRLAFRWGQRATFRVSEATLNLVTPRRTTNPVPWNEVASPE